MARGQSSSSSYFPFAFSPLIEEPWGHSLFEHKKAQEGWANRMKSLNSEQSLSSQSLVLFGLGLILPAQTCGAWDLFGGLTAQIKNLGVALNIAAADNVGIALNYYEFLHAQLESYSRRRATDVDCFRLLSGGQLDIRRRFARTPSATEGSSSSLPGWEADSQGYYGLLHTLTYLLSLLLYVAAFRDQHYSSRHSDLA